MSGLLNRLKTRSKTVSNNANESTTTSFDEEGFLCPLCHQKFSNHTQLAQHYTETHAQETKESIPDDPNREIAIWKQQFTASEETRVMLTNELIQERQKSNDLAEELHIVQKQLKSSQAKVSEQLLEIANLKATRDVYDAQLTIFSNELLTTQNQLKEKQEQLDILSSKSSSDDIDVLKHELISIQHRMNDISIEKEKEIERLQMILIEISRYNQRFDQIENQYQQNLSTFDQLITKYLSPIETEINKLRQSIQLVQKHKQILRNVLLKKQNHIQQLNTTLVQQKQTYEKQLTFFQNQIHELEQSLSEKKEFIETKLEGDDILGQLTKEKYLFEEQNRELRNQIQQIQHKYEQLSQQFAQNTIEKNQLNMIKQEKERQMIELTNLREKYENNLREAISQKQDLAQMKLQLAQSEQNIQKSAQHIQFIQKEKETIVQQLQTTLSQLHIKLEHRDNRIKRLSIGIQHSIVLAHRTLEYIDESILPNQINILKIIEQSGQDARLIREKTFEDIQFDFTNYLTTIHSIILDNKKQIEVDQSNLREKEEQLIKIKTDHESLNKQYQNLSELTRTLNQQREKYEKQISSYEREFESRTKRHEMQLAALTENLASVRTELKQNQEKLAMIDPIKAEKADIEARLSVSQDERRVLLERSLAIENKNEKLISENAQLTKKISEIESALQEIAREYQVLQIQTNKLSQRRWLDDEDVDACMKCNHTFTVRQRKHHCRNCGNIFCDNCSSKTAIIGATSRKQKRVCDQCYKDLTV